MALTEAYLLMEDSQASIQIMAGERNSEVGLVTREMRMDPAIARKQRFVITDAVRQALLQVRKGG